MTDAMTRLTSAHGWTACHDPDDTGGESDQRAESRGERNSELACAQQRC
jgi:hypothetical protein